MVVFPGRLSLLTSFLFLLQASSGSIVISPKPNDNKISANIGGEFVITCTATGNDETKPNALEWRSSINGVIQDNTNLRFVHCTPLTP
jgi:hypothetical protein